MRGDPHASEVVMERPSTVVDNITAFIHALSPIEDYFGLNVAEISKGCLLRQIRAPGGAVLGESFLTATERGNAFESQKAEGGNEKERTLAELYGKFYADFLDSLTRTEAVFSPARQCFLSRVQSHSSVDAAHYLSSKEMSSLARLLGPLGVKAVDHALLNYLDTNLKLLKEYVTALRPAMTEFSQTFEEGNVVPVFSRVVGSADIDNFVVVAVDTGRIMTLRSMLHSALADVLREEHVDLFTCLENAVLAGEKDHHLRCLLPKEKNTIGDFDAYAMDIGLLSESAVVDASILESIRQIKTSKEDEALWSLLPLVFASCIVSNHWRKVEYRVYSEALTNDLHELVHVLLMLVVGLQAVTLAKASGEAPSFDAQLSAVRESLHTFVSAASVLAIKLSMETERKEVGAMLVFIDKVISAVDSLDIEAGARHHSAVQYGLIRSTYAATYLAAAAQAREKGLTEGGTEDLQGEGDANAGHGHGHSAAVSVGDNETSASNHREDRPSD